MCLDIFVLYWYTYFALFTFGFFVFGIFCYIGIEHLIWRLEVMDGWRKIFMHMSLVLYLSYA